MEQTDNQQLPYPDCDDPGAGALDLQILAEAIDAKLTDQFAAFRGVVNRPAIVFGLSAPQTGVTAGVTTQVNYDTVVFNSSRLAVTASAQLRFCEPGYWMIGSYVPITVSGALTANAELLVRIFYRGDLYVPLGGSVINQAGSKNYIGTTAGDNCEAVTIVRQEYDDPANVFGGSFTVEVQNGNVASTLTVGVNANAWAFKICNLEDM